MSEKFFCLLFVCLVGILCGVKKTYRRSFALMTNSCHPFVDRLVPSNTSIAGRAIFGRWSVLLILAVGCKSQIFKSVVSLVSVYVVKMKPVWNFSKHQDPNGPMKFVRLGFDGHHLVSRPMNATSYGALNHV